MSEHGYKDGDRVLVTVEDQRIVRMRTGTYALQLRFVHPERGAIVGNVWLTEKCAGMIRGFLRAVGLDPDSVDIAQLDPGHEQPISIIGKEVFVTCKEREFKGRWSVQVAYIDPPKALTPNFDSITKAVKECKQTEDDADKNAEPNF